jgi:hypothetical protein
MERLARRQENFSINEVLLADRTYLETIIRVLPQFVWDDYLLSPPDLHISWNQFQTLRCATAYN